MEEEAAAAAELLTRTLISRGHGDYAGGYVGIVAKGNIEISSKGRIEADGGKGGNGGNGANNFTDYIAGGGSGGGGAGGGVITLFYQGEFSNLGTITVNGGAGEWR